jgi:transglutaminase-like putative cysteine protease
MTFGREKRVLLGMLALLAPLPLPFNDILEWPVFGFFALIVGYFLLRSRRQDDEWLPVWAINLLGLAYMPFLAYDLLVLGRATLVGPVVHLLLFAVVAKLFSLRRERDKWHVLLSVFFLFLAAMATSVHPTIVLYLAVFLGLTLLVLTRFALLHVLTGFGRDDPATAAVPLYGFLTAVTLLILVVAVPLFAVLPRVRAPYIIGRGVGSGTPVEAIGFNDQVTLDSIGLARSNRTVVMRLRYADEQPPGHEMRFKAGAHDLYANKVWKRTPRDGETLRRSGLRFELTPQPPRHWVEVWLRPLTGSLLALPVEAVAVEAISPFLSRSRLGTVSLPNTVASVVQYRVGMQNRPLVAAPPPDPSSDEEPALDRGGLTPRIAALAARVASEADAAGDARRTADAIQQFLTTDYEYSLDFLGHSGDEPLEDFLFRYKAGHCEYFASAMVVMLRAEGVPARLATGFLGGEFNPIEGYYIVRQLNAHAWVEAYIDGAWRIYDPTPAAGRPGGPRDGLGNLLTQAWDYLEFRWDRYVLTYGFYDQIQFFLGVRDGWQKLWGFFARWGEDSPSQEAAPEAAQTPSVEGAAASPPVIPWWRRWGPPLFFAALLLAMLVMRWRQGRPAGATGAYQALRRRLRRAGLPLAPSLAPLAMVEGVATHFPAAAQPAGMVVALYLRESFGGVRLAEAERELLRRASMQAARALRSKSTQELVAGAEGSEHRSAPPTGATPPT